METARLHPRSGVALQHGVYSKLGVRKHTRDRYNFILVSAQLTVQLLKLAKVAELVDALVLGTSGGTRESSSLSFRTNCPG